MRGLRSSHFASIRPTPGSSTRRGIASRRGNSLIPPPAHVARRSEVCPRTRTVRHSRDSLRGQGRPVWTWHPRAPRADAIINQYRKLVFAYTISTTHNINRKLGAGSPPTEGAQGEGARGLRAPPAPSKLHHLERFAPDETRGDIERAWSARPPLPAALRGDHSA